MGEERSEEHCRHGAHPEEKRYGRASGRKRRRGREGVGGYSREGRHPNASGVGVRGYARAGKKLSGEKKHGSESSVNTRFTSQDVTKPYR